MITDSQPPRSIRLLPVFILILLLGTLSVACSDILTSSPVEELTTTNLSTENMMSTELPGWQLQNEEEEAAARAYLGAFQREIRYPKAAREQGMTHRYTVRAHVNSDGDFAGDYGPAENLHGARSLELVVAGLADPEVKLNSATTDESFAIFSEEIGRVIKSLENNFKPVDRNSAPISFSFTFDVIFQLKQ